MTLKNALRGQAALEYILLASVTIIALIGADYLFKIKSDGKGAGGGQHAYSANGFFNHFNSMQNVIRAGMTQ